MNTRNSISSLFVLLILCASGRLCGQPGYKTKWEKTVTREIEISSKDAPAATRKSKPAPGITLTETIVNALKAKKLAAYSNFDLTLNTKLDDYELNEIIDRHDVMDVKHITDPVTGKSVAKVIDHGINYNAIHKYRILEHWKFNPSSGKTEIQILGIAPIRGVYSSGGVFMGVQAMFWLHYADVRPILDQYERSYPKQSLTSLIWKDYFANEQEPDIEGGVWATRAERMIDMQAEDTVVHHLTDVSQPDTTLLEFIENQIIPGRINVYPRSDDRFTSKLPATEIESMFTNRVDSQAITDPVTNLEVTKMITHDSYNLYFNKYRILEHWRFNIQNGKIEIQIIGVAPKDIGYDADGKLSDAKPVYWLKYDDIKGILTAYDLSHPRNTFAGHIWDDYFLSDIRPTAIK